MNRTRIAKNNKGAPSVDPSTLKPETVRKGKDGKWWVLLSGEWTHVNQGVPRKMKRKTKKNKNKNKIATLGMITVNFNTPEKCDLIGAKDCVIPEFSDFRFSESPKTDGLGLDTWHHAYSERTPPYGEFKYTKFDQYIGSLSLMPSSIKQLQAHYAKYKRLGSISEFEIKGVPWAPY